MQQALTGWTEGIDAARRAGPNAAYGTLQAADDLPAGKLVELLAGQASASLGALVVQTL
jgi:hypothetical protein